jgi:hypothetical protein
MRLTITPEAFFLLSFLVSSLGILDTSSENLRLNIHNATAWLTRVS